MTTTRKIAGLPFQVHCAAALLAGTFATGCSSLIDPNVPALIRAHVEPEYGRAYLLYRPSSYNREQAWPLIVACHTSFPDSPNKRIRAWTQLAESVGFLVAAPELKGNRKDWTPKAEKQISLQKEDEDHILAMIRHVRGAHNISHDRIFIHGFSGGAYAAVFTGLRNPDVFRAIGVSQPKFNEDLLADVADTVDPHQPALVSCSIADTLTGKHGRRCVEWLRARLVNLTNDTGGPGRETDAQRHVEFFESVLRRHPWIRIRALPARDDEPLAIQFKLRYSTGTPVRWQWSFGDGGESTQAEPIHVYAVPGTYHVTVTVELAKSGPHRRAVALAVPQATTSGAGIAPDP